MPVEKRDKHSGALLFVPTNSERATVRSARELQKQLEEVNKMKSELKELLEQAKKGNAKESN